MKEKVKNYLLNNMSTLKDVVSQMNGNDDCFHNLDYYEHDNYFFRTFFENDYDGLARAIYYGDYHYNEPYIKINDYGNLETASDYKWEQELKENINEIVDHLFETKDEINIYDKELKEMLEKGE